MYCARCRVEVNNTERVCPLCGGELSRERTEIRDARPYPEQEPKKRRMAKTKKSSPAVFAFAAAVFSALMGIADIFKAEISYALPQSADLIHYISLPVVTAVTTAIVFMMLFSVIKNGIRKRFFV